jgi:aspartate beta-hydroxylase
LSLALAQLDAYFAEAQAARSHGDMAAYVRRLEAIIAQAEHPRALNALGNHAVNSGDAARGVALLERAVRADPQAPPLWFNLSLGCRARGDIPRELDALTEVLRLDPYYIPAMVHKGEALARSGHARQAVSFFKDALACAEAQPELAAQTAPALLQAARAAVEQNAALLDAHLAGALDHVRSCHGGSDSARFAEMLDIYHGRKRYQLQKPTLLPFPDLPPIAFHARADFAWADALEAATPDIQSELANVLAAGEAQLTPYIQHGAGRPLAQWQALNHSPRWSAYHLLQNGTRIDAHIAQCPKTMALLDASPLADVPGNAPNAFFSVLKPQTRIPPHTGMTNTRLVLHLPLIVPEQCGFRVGNHTRAWEVGKAWVFDDTIEHEAWNLSDHTRIILIVDLWNPLLSDLEKDLIRAFFDGLSSFNADGLRLSAGL